VTQWESDADFQNWVKSSAFTRGHVQARADHEGTRPPVAHGSAVMEFEVVDLETPAA
jgi:heme-degrading monooxygenase HmoA